MIDPVQVMRFGTPETVRRQATQMLATMGPGGGFIIGPGCALPADTPLENVQRSWSACAAKASTTPRDNRRRIRLEMKRSTIDVEI